jgi:hypothetical protein
MNFAIEDHAAQPLVVSQRRSHTRSAADGTGIPTISSRLHVLQIDSRARFGTFIFTRTTRRNVFACWFTSASYDPSGSSGIVCERLQITSDVRGASSKSVKIDRKLFSGNGFVVPSKSTTSSLRFGTENGSVFSRARVRSCQSPIGSASRKGARPEGSPPK